MPSAPRFPSEWEAICLLARAAPGSGASVVALPPAGYERAVETAHAHNVLGVVLSTIRAAGHALPAPLQERLAAADRLLAAQALFRQSELEVVLSVLETAGAEVAVLKGAFLASCVYEDFAQRPMSDFDLLVRREDLPRAATALQREGYRGEEGWPCQVPPGGSLELQSPSGQAIELRYDLAQGTRLRGVVNFPEAEMWQRLRTFKTVPGHAMQSLEPTDHLLYLAYHTGILHLFAALVWLVDIDRFIRKFRREIAWDDLPARARRIGCATCLWHGLGLARRLLGTPVKDSVLRALRPGTLRARIVQGWLTPQRLFRGMTPPEQPRMQLLQMLLLDTTGADLRSFWQGLFPPRQWLQWRYRTSHPVALLFLRTLYPFGGWARPRT